MVRRIEELSMNAWPCLVSNLYDGCIIRFSNGYTKRANSANPLYSNMENIGSLVTYVESIYEKEKLPIVFKVLGIKDYEKLNGYLEKNKYERIDSTDVMTIAIDQFHETTSTSVMIDDSFTEEWLTAFMEMNKVGLNEKTARSMLGNIVGTKYVASITNGKKLIACGYGAVEEGYVGFFDIVVKEEMRGKGYGKAIMTGIINRAKKEHINKGYLQVVSSNKKAKEMYTKLGFVEDYKYWYMRKI
jgi:GNAT superfamily N-acetyltransferase